MDQLQKRQLKSNKINLSVDRRVSTNDVGAELSGQQKRTPMSPKSSSQIFSAGQFYQHVDRQLNQSNESQNSDANQRLKGLSGSLNCGNSSQNTGDFPAIHFQNKLATQAIKSGNQESFYPSSEQLQDITGPHLVDGYAFPPDYLDQYGQDQNQRKSGGDSFCEQVDFNRSSTPLKFNHIGQNISSQDASEKADTLQVKREKSYQQVESSGDQKSISNSSLQQSFGGVGAQQISDRNNLNILSQPTAEQAKQGARDAAISGNHNEISLEYEHNVSEKPEINIYSPEDIINPHRAATQEVQTVTQFELQGNAIASSLEKRASTKLPSGSKEDHKLKGILDSHPIGRNSDQISKSKEKLQNIAESSIIPKIRKSQPQFVCDGEFSLGSGAAQRFQSRNPLQSFPFVFANQQQASRELIIHDSGNTQYEDSPDPSSALPKIYTIENENDLAQEFNQGNSSMKQLTEQSDHNKGYQNSFLERNQSSQSREAKELLYQRLQIKKMANMNNTESFGVIQSNSHQSLDSEQKHNNLPSIGQLFNQNNQRESILIDQQSQGRSYGSLSRDTSEPFAINFDQNLPQDQASMPFSNLDMKEKSSQDNYLQVPLQQSLARTEQQLLQEESPQILADIMRGKQALQGLKKQQSQQTKRVSSSHHLKDAPSQGSSNTHNKQKSMKDGTNSSVHDAGQESNQTVSDKIKKETIVVESEQRGQSTFNGQQNRKQRLSIDKANVKESNITETPGFPRQQCSIKEKVGRLASKRHQDRNKDSGGSGETGSGEKVQIWSQAYDTVRKNDMQSSSGEGIPIDPRKIQEQLQCLSSEGQKQDSPQAQTLGKASVMAISETRQNFNNLATRYAQGADPREGCHTTQRSKYSIASMSGLGFDPKEINSDYQNSQSPRMHDQGVRIDSMLLKEESNAQQIDFWTKQPKNSGPSASNAADESPRRQNKRPSHRNQQQKGYIKIQIKSEALSNGDKGRTPFSVAGHSINSPGENYDDQSVPIRQKRSRNQIIKSRKFYNSMSKLDRINVMTDKANVLEDQISLNFIHIEGDGLIDAGQSGIIFISPVAQDGVESQSIKRHNDAQHAQVLNQKSNSNIETQNAVHGTYGTEENKESGILKRMSSHEEQVQGSKTSMSDLVGEVIDRNATNSFQFTNIPKRGRTYTFQKGSIDGNSPLERTRNQKIARGLWKNPLEGEKFTVDAESDKNALLREANLSSHHATGPNQSFNEEHERLRVESENEGSNHYETPKMGPALKGGFSSHPLAKNGKLSHGQQEKLPSQFKPKPQKSDKTVNRNQIINSDKTVNRKENGFTIDLRARNNNQRPRQHKNLNLRIDPESEEEEAIYQLGQEQNENGDVGSSNSASAMSMMAQRPTRQEHGSSGQNNSGQDNQAQMTFEKDQELPRAMSGNENPSVGAGGSNEEYIELHNGPNTSNADYDTDQQIGQNLLGSDNGHQDTVSEQIQAKKYCLVQDKIRLKWSNEMDANSQFSASKTHQGYIDYQNQFENVHRGNRPFLKKSSSNVYEKNQASQNQRQGFQLIPLKVDLPIQEIDLEQKLKELESDNDEEFVKSLPSQEEQTIDMRDKTYHPLESKGSQQAAMRLPAFGNFSRVVDQYIENELLPQTHNTVLENLIDNSPIIGAQRTEKLVECQPIEATQAFRGYQMRGITPEEAQNALSTQKFESEVSPKNQQMIQDAHRQSLKSQKQNMMTKKSSTLIEGQISSNNMRPVTHKMSNTMISKDFLEGRFDKLSVGKLERSQEEISDCSRFTQVRQDIGSPVMRKSNLSALRGRREMMRRKMTKNLTGVQETAKTSNDEGVKSKDCPSVSSTSGYSRRVSKQDQIGAKRLVQRQKTINPKSIRHVEAGASRMETRKSELPTAAVAHFALQNQDPCIIDVLSQDGSSGIPMTASNKSILPSLKNQDSQSPPGQINSDEGIANNARARNLKVSQYRQLTQDMFLQLYRIQDLTSEDYVEVPFEKQINFKFTRKGMTKLLLFDLDETLIHIWRGLGPERFVPEQEITIKHWRTGEDEKWGLSVRPYVRECLEFANKHFEVGIFTASHQCFAEQVIDFLDPKKELIHHRYYNQHARLVEDDEDTFVVKDMNIFKGEVSLDNILIVDNNIYSFAYQLENGIPILDFVGDPCDTELLKVRETLNHLKGFSNLRKECERTFRLREIYNQDMALFIHYYDSEGWSDGDEAFKDFDDDGRTEYRTVSYKKGYNKSDRVAEEDAESEVESNIDRGLSVCSSVDQVNFNLNRRSKLGVQSPSSFTPGGRQYEMELPQLHYGIGTRPKSPNPGANIGIKLPLNQSNKSTFMQLKVLKHQSQLEYESNEEADGFIQDDLQNNGPSSMSQGSPNQKALPSSSTADKVASSLDVQIQLPSQIDLTFANSRRGIPQEFPYLKSQSNSPQSPDSNFIHQPAQQLPSFRNSLVNSGVQNQIYSINRINFQVSTNLIDNSPLSQLVDQNLRQNIVNEVTGPQNQEQDRQIMSQEVQNLQVPQPNAVEVQRLDQVESGSSGGTPSLELKQQMRQPQGTHFVIRPLTQMIDEDSDRIDPSPPNQQQTNEAVASNVSERRMAGNQNLLSQKLQMPQIRVSADQSFEYRRVDDSEAPSELQQFDGQPPAQDFKIETDSILRNSEFQPSPQNNNQNQKGGNMAQEARKKQKAAKMGIQLNQVKEIDQTSSHQTAQLIKLKMTDSPIVEELKLTDYTPTPGNTRKNITVQEFNYIIDAKQDSDDQIDSSQIENKQKSTERNIKIVEPVSLQESNFLPQPFKLSTEQNSTSIMPIDIKNGRQSISQNQNDNKTLGFGQNPSTVNKLNIFKNSSSIRRQSVVQTNPNSTITAPNWDARRQTYDRRQKRRQIEERQRGNSLPVDKIRSLNETKSRKQSQKKKSRSGQSEVALYRYCVNIDNQLDNLFSEMDRYWKQGSMKNDIMKYNPNIKSEFIIEPKLQKQNKSHQVKPQKSLSILAPKNSEIAIDSADNVQPNEVQASGNFIHQLNVSPELNLVRVLRPVITTNKNQSSHTNTSLSPTALQVSQYRAMTNVPASAQKLSAFKNLASPQNKSFLFSDSKARMGSLLNINRKQSSMTTTKKRSNTLMQTPFQARESQDADEQSRKQKLREYYGTVCSESDDYFNFNQASAGFSSSINALQSLGSNQRSRQQHPRKLTSSNFMTPVKQFNQSQRNGPRLSSNQQPLYLQKSQAQSQNKH